MHISIVTPAHNEEKLIANCIASVALAATRSGVEYEHIIVVNRCTDRTEQIGRELGCRIVHEDARNLSRIRNAGVEAASGSVIATIDADSTIAPNMLAEVVRRLGSGQTIGGGVRVMPERWSPGIACSLLVVVPFLLRQRVSTGMFWCHKRDFEAIGGFDESLVCIEDIDFGLRLRDYAKQQGLAYDTIRNASLITSCRKFDQFGDWYFVRHPGIVWDIFRRKQLAADRFYYDARSNNPAAERALKKRPL